jgi:hypothetical protein
MKLSARFGAIVVAIAVAAAARPVEAAKISRFDAIGSGTTFTTDCTPSSSFCNATFSGHLQSNLLGAATVTATLVVNHSSGFVCIDATCANQCFGASGTGTVTKVRTGDTITFGESGLLCSVPPTFVPETFNGTYFVEGGTGAFANEVGAGNATASANGSLSAPVILFSLDGTLAPNVPE